LEQFEKMKAVRTLTIKAIDLHIIDTSVDSIRLGMNVALRSTPHGLNEPDICSAIDLNIEKPEESEYTFGEPQKSLTDSNEARNKQYNANMNHMHKWLKETNDSFEVKVDALNSKILLQADAIKAQAKEIQMVAEKFEVEGYVKMGDDVDIGSLYAENVNSPSISGDAVSADEMRTGSLTVNGDALTKHSLKVVTGIDVVTSLEGRITAVQPITAQISYYA